jgi:hypothetical protein
VSNLLAIATVTEKLRSLIISGITKATIGDLQCDPGVPDTQVTALPLDKARGNRTCNQINIFLYRVNYSAAWRNTGRSINAKSGESAQPPLALDLFYILSAYGKDDEDVNGHRLLGLAMSILNDNPILSFDKDTLPGSDSDLYLQAEHVRITPMPFSLDDLSKLWMSFQIPYRVSVAYQVSVVLIDSLLPAKAPLPILRRGDGNRGWDSRASPKPPLSPLPTLTEIVTPHQPPCAMPGETIALTGYNLNGSSMEVQLNNPHLLGTYKRSLLAVTVPDLISMNFVVPDDPDNLPAGLYLMSLAIVPEGLPGQVRKTNELPFSLAPSITIAPLNPPHGDIIFTVTCNPKVLPEQRVSFLLGDREILPEAFTSPANTLQFKATNVPAGEYLARLRVDGVDCVLIQPPSPPGQPYSTFDQTKKVVVT